MLETELSIILLFLPEIVTFPAVKIQMTVLMYRKKEIFASYNFLRYFAVDCVPQKLKTTEYFRSFAKVL